MVNSSFELVADEIPIAGTEFTYQIVGRLEQFSGAEKRLPERFYISNVVHTEEFIYFVKPEDKIIDCDIERKECISSLYRYLIKSVDKIMQYLRISYMKRYHKETSTQYFKPVFFI
mgnify:CR=1 FL=1